MNVGNPYMSRCGTMFAEDEEERKTLDRIAKLRRLGDGYANFHESIAAQNKAAELERKLLEKRAEREREGLEEILRGIERIALRHYAIADALQDVITKCRVRQTARGIEDMVAYAFNAQGIDAQFGGGGGLPAGKHPVTITKTAAKSTKDNTGGYVALTCTAFDGPNKGGSMDIRLNLHNTSADAVRIANQQLAAICAVTGVFQFQDTDELQNKPFVIEVAPQKSNPQYTEVVAIFDMDGNEPGKAGTGPMQGGAPNGGFPSNNGGGAAGGGFPNGQQGQGGGFPDPNANQGGAGQGQQNTGQQGGGAAWGQQNTGQGGQAGQGGGNGAAWGQNNGGGAAQGGGQASGWQQGGAGQGGGSGGGTPGWGQR